MKYELKIALPMYKIIYSMLFMVIIILVRPIMSYNEIVSVLESSVALLAGVFMADIYYMEYMNERISTYSLFPIKQKRGSILKRAFISQLYLIVLVAVFYWGFVLVYHPTNYSGVPVISLYASCMGACAASMFFMGTFCFTATNLMRNIGLAIGLLFFFWLLLTSTIIRVLPEILQLFKLSGEVVQDGYLIPFWPSRILYVVCAVALMYWNLHLVNQQPDFNKKGGVNMGIKVCDLVMEYKKGVKVLNHVNLTIEHGIYGLLGENGAGKTTLMKILVTLLTPTSGTVEINGLTVKPENYEIIKKQIGYLPQEFGLYPNLTVREALEYVGIMSGMEKAEYQKQIDYYLEATGLSAHQKKKNRQLSGGMKRRVGLIQALLHNPSVLIVDEPTTGLDPEERIRIRNLLFDFSADRTVLFSTHVTEDLAATCNQLAVMKKGHFLYSGNMSELIEQAQGHVWKCRVSNENKAREVEQRYHVSAKQLTSDGLLMKIISSSHPDIECWPCEASLEDAYIYLSNIKT